MGFLRAGECALASARTPWDLGLVEALSVLSKGKGLLFVEVWQARHRIMALVDSGAEVNLIGADLLPVLTYSVVEAVSPRVRGVGGALSPIVEWVKTSLTLENGFVYKGVFAALKELGTACILGMPFLRSSEAVVDFKFDVLRLGAGGSVGLWPARLMPSPAADCAVAAVEVEEVPSPDPAKDPLAEDVKPTSSLSAEEEAARAAASDFLTPEQQSAVKEVLLKNATLWLNSRRGVTRVLSFDMKLSDDRPISCRPRRFALQEQQVIDKEIDSMLSSGVVEHSVSPYASEVVLVKKKTGDWRICIDFRMINAKTIVDKFPLPRVQDLLRAVRDATHFVSLDLRAGYWQIPVSEGSKKFTAFRSSRGLLQFLVMPFGLVNAPAVFQRLMSLVLGDLYWNGVVVYLDDVLVFGTSFEQCLSRLEVVFERLKAANLTLRLDKCDFFPRRIKYLGFWVEDGKLSPVEGRVAALERIVKPRCVRDVRSLLGLTGFYRMFVDHYAEKAEPLTRLLSKSESFAWGPEQDQALAQLVEALKGATLTNPLEGDLFRVYCDASGLAVAGMLVCSADGVEWSPVEFVSYVLSETQRKWPSFEKEAYAIVRSVKSFDYYLRGRAFDVFTDCRSLLWMHQSLKPKVQRWAMVLGEYQLSIYHLDGVKMQHVDFLSRYVRDDDCVVEERMFPEEEPSPFVATIDVGLEERVSLVPSDQKPFPTIEVVREAQLAEPPLWGKAFAKSEGLVFYRGRVYVPPSLRQQVLLAAHLLNPLVHAGARKTKSCIARVFGWPRIDEDVAAFVRGCLPCQRIRPGIEVLHGALRHHEQTHLLEKVYVDTWECTIRRTRHLVLTMIDYSSRWAEAVPLKDGTSAECARQFISAWVCRFGVPAVVVTDQGTCFMAEEFTEACRRFGIQTVRTSVSHPQGNAPVETFHRVLVKGFAHFCLSTPSSLSFEEALCLILMGYRATIHLSTRESPAFLLYGVDMRPAVERDWRSFRAVADRDRALYLSLIRLDIQAKALQAQQLLEEKFQKDRLVREFRVGDLVLMRYSEKEWVTLSRMYGSRKIVPKWSIPYRVERVYRSGTVALLRSVVSGFRRFATMREVQLQNARFIEPPGSEEMQRLWDSAIKGAVESTALDPSTANRLLSTDWEDFESAYSERRKRPRRLVEAPVAGGG